MILFLKIKIEALEEKSENVEDSLKKRIKAIQSRDILKSLLRLAIRAGSISEFEERL